ncbi:MAG: sensor domain-containing diguanylate cyclase [Rhodoferax sp.]
MSDAVLNSLTNQIAVIDQSGVILYVNLAWHAFATSNGMAADHQWIGTNYLSVCDGDEPQPNSETDSAKTYPGMVGVIEGRADSFVYEYPCHSPTEKRWFLMRMGPLWGRPGRFVISHHNITARVLVEEEVRRLAFYDPLTNLPNRRLLMDRLKRAMASSSRSCQHGALLFLDLDHFKQLNDSLGHAMGDELLKQVAVRLQACVREVDSVARLGGDEFVVLLEDLSVESAQARSQAEVIANKILSTLGSPYTLGDNLYSSTPSIGAVVFLQDHETILELLRRADDAMYQSKAAGRNTVHFYRVEPTPA